MFRRILVPLDGSLSAERALPLAVGLAQTSGGSLILLRATQPGASPATIQSSHEYLERKLAGLQLMGAVAETEVISNEPATAIVAATCRHRAELVVMVTHARIEPELLVRGSVAERVVRDSHVPVLLLRGADVRSNPLRTHDIVEPFIARRHAEEAEEPRHATILVPLDGTVWSEAALRVAQRFARQLGAELLLVQAVQVANLVLEVAALTPVDVSADLETRYAEAEAYLDAVAKRLRAQGYLARWSVDAATPSAAVLDAERQVHPALVVMATHAREGLSRLVFGSVTSSVLHDGGAPVVAVPTGAMQRRPAA